MNNNARPAIVDDKHLTYLDRLRKSGATNMFGADAYLQSAFGIDRHEAREILKYWMTSFDERHPR